MSGVMSSLQGVLGNLSSTFWSILNKIFPPEQRAEMISKLKNFAINNPKLAAFLTAQIVFTGPPLVLFIAFTVTVAVFSLIAALLIALLVAVLFIVAMVGVALLIVLPTIFFTTFAASFLFLWGLGGYHLLKWFNEGEMPAEPGKALGDKINNLTGGRMNWLMDGSRKKQEDRATGVDQTPKTHGSEKNKENETNGSANRTPDVQKHANQAKEQTSKQVDGVHKRPPKLAEKGTNPATKSGVSNTTGTAL